MVTAKDYEQDIQTYMKKWEYYTQTVNPENEKSFWAVFPENEKCEPLVYLGSNGSWKWYAVRRYNIIIKSNNRCPCNLSDNYVK